MATKKTQTGLGDGEANAGKEMIAEQVLIVSAPAGPRRRAGLSFGPEPRELREQDLGPDPEETLEALRADPMLKIDGRVASYPASEENEE